MFIATGSLTKGRLANDVILFLGGMNGYGYLFHINPFPPTLVWL